MKTKGILLAIIVNMAVLTGFAQRASTRSPFVELMQDTWITSTFVGKAMLEFAPNMKVGSSSIVELSTVLDQIEIYTNPKVDSSNWRLGRWIYNHAVEAIMYKYNLQLKIEDKEQKITCIYSKPAKDSDKLSEVVVITLGKKDLPENCTVIRLVGNFTMKDIKKIMAK